MDQDLTITLTLTDGSQVSGFLIGRSDTHTHIRLLQVYETEQSIWLPGNEKAFANTEILSPVNQQLA